MLRINIVHKLIMKIVQYSININYIRLAVIEGINGELDLNLPV